MSQHALAAPLPRLERRPLARVLACIAVAAVAVAGGFGVDRLVHGGRPPLSVPLYTAPGHAFRIALPHGWHPLAGARLRALNPAPTAVLSRDDRRGAIVVRPAPALHGTPAQSIAQLSAQLRSRLHGFKPVSAHVARLRSGQAIVYTFVRDPAGTVQTLVIAPANRRLWQIDAIVPGGANDAARQVGAMLATFGS